MRNECGMCWDGIRVRIDLRPSFYGDCFRVKTLKLLMAGDIGNKAKEFPD